MDCERSDALAGADTEEEVTTTDCDLETRTGVLFTADETTTATADDDDDDDDVGGGSLSFNVFKEIVGVVPSSFSSTGIHCRKESYKISGKI